MSIAFSGCSFQLECQNIPFNQPCTRSSGAKIWEERTSCTLLFEIKYSTRKMALKKHTIFFLFAQMTFKCKDEVTSLSFIVPKSKWSYPEI